MNVKVRSSLWISMGVCVCQAVDGQLYPCPRSLAPPLLIRDPRSGGGLPELPS